MSQNEQEIRIRLTNVGKQLHKKDLNIGDFGNISARIPRTTKCIIKPSGYSLDELNPEDFIIVDINSRKIISGN